MIVKTYSYRFAEEVLEHPDFAAIRDELLEICKDCPIPTFAGKSSTQPGKDVVQQVMNTYFRRRFEKLGWEVEPLATPDTHEDALRSDFRKKFTIAPEKSITLQIEVEFGNVASSYRNLFKFQLSFSYGLTDMCVLILPSKNLSKRIDSGVSNYQKVIREIPQAKLSVTVPVYVIGLFDRDEGTGMPEPAWDLVKDGISLDIAKDQNKTVHPQHIALVDSYIDSLRTHEAS